MTKEEKPKKEDTENQIPENTENQVNQVKSKENKKPEKKKQSLTEKTVKNSMYNFTGTIISRAGGLIFTIILARMLLPELFGIYSLVLSIIGIFMVFTDLGISNTLVRYVSDALGKGKKAKASAYINYLIKFRFYLITGVIFIIIVFGKIISNNIFQKPVIFVPLMFACLYLLMKVLFGFFRSMFNAVQNLKKIAIMEFLFQISRIGLVVLAIYIISEENLVSGVFVSLALALFFTSLCAFIKTDKKLLFNKDSSKENVDKKRILSYLGFVSLVSISMKFFGSIDTLMLGRAVSVEYLGFYRAALNLATSVGSLFGFGAVFLPIFTQLQGNRFERGFKKAFKSIVIFTIPSVFGAWIIAKYFILAIYGKEYIISVIPFYALAFVIFLMPLISLYSSFFQAREKPKILTKAVLFSLGLNIILNIVFIKYFPIWFNKGPEFAILGAAIATILSRTMYLLTLIRKKNLFTGIRKEGSYLIKPIIASLIMGGFLIGFASLVDMNLIFGIMEIILGAGIYFLTMRLINGIRKEDVDLMKKIFINKFRKIKGN